MLHAEVEYWVREIVDRVKAGQHIEDSRVELKSTWPTEMQKTARHIAALCNAARGNSALLIVGVDEDLGLVGVDANNTANWRGAVARFFDGHMPACTDYSFNIDGKSVLAVLFDTVSAPYVVTAPGGGHISYEVPWRDVTGTRSARRADLLNILAPQLQLPMVQLMGGSLATYCSEDPPTQAGKWDSIFKLRVYVIPRTQDCVVLPLHMMRVSASEDNGATQFDGKFTYVIQDERRDVCVNQVIVTAPSFLEIQATYAGMLAFAQRSPVDVVFEAGLPGLPFKANASLKLQPRLRVERRHPFMVTCWGDEPDYTVGFEATQRRS